MISIFSSCCEFRIGKIEDAVAYCYVCGNVHKHEHLDLRSLRTVLMGKVVRRHNLNWNEIEKDAKKFGGMKRGDFCQSVLTEMEALCPHGNPVIYNGKPLRLHMCYGADSGKKGLDFTSDLCFFTDSAGAQPSLGQANTADEAEKRANEFKIGSILKYNPTRFAFELS